MQHFFDSGVDSAGNSLNFSSGTCVDTAANVRER